MNLKVKKQKFLFLLIVLCAYTAVYSQTIETTFVNLSKSNYANITTVFKEIENQSNFKIVHDDAVLNTKKNLVFSSQKASVKAILNTLKMQSNIDYAVKSNTILIKQKAIQSQERNQQQNAKVSGIITDENNLPLPNVSIIEKNTTNGVISDFDGNFSIKTTTVNPVLVFSYVGYQTKETVVMNQAQINIQLLPNQSQLEEVVVVGYGNQKKANITGAVGIVKAKAIANRPITQASQALQGLTPGVFVNTESGEAGNDAASIRIRGIGSLNQSSSPLVLIDGIEASINDIDPLDVESISVLKDAASASIYGTRGAANGVILITTKSGGYDKEPEVQYSTYSGFSSPTVLPKMVLDARTYMETYRQAAMNSGRKFNFTDEDIDRYANMPTTNWQDILLRKAAPIQKHNLSFSGGNKTVNYYFSTGYLNQQGWVGQNQNFKRYNARLKLNTKLNDKFNLGTTLSYIRNDANLTPKDEFGKSAGGKGSTLFSSAIVAHPITPVYTSSGYYGSIENKLGIERNRPNGQGIMDNETGNLTEDNILGNAFLEYNITKNISLKATVGLNVENETILEIKKEYQSFDAITEKAITNGNGYRNIGSSLEQQASKDIEVTNNIQLNYHLNLSENHNFKFLGGFERYVRVRDKSRIKETLFGSKSLVFLGNGTARETSGLTGEKSSLISFFSRLNYAYKNKYLVEANFRRDGSSRFGANNRWGNFPSFSAGWVVSKEAFWGDNFINYFKVRGSWGLLGSEPDDRFGYLSQLELGKDYINNSGGAVDKIGNPNLKWEETATTNIGFNAAFFGNKVTLEGDYFIKKTTDILVGLENPLTSGIRGNTTFNGASMENKGWEASLQYTDNIGNFKFSIGGNITNVKNKILAINSDLSGGDDVIEKDRSDNIWWIRGESINVIYGHQFAGIFQSQEEIDASPDHSFIGKPAPGDIKYTDQNGDGVIDLKDRVILGNRNPEWLYGFNLDASYKGFEFSVLFQGIGDAYVNLARETGPFPFAGLRSYWQDAWTPENPNNNIPRVWVDRQGYNGQSMEQAGKYNSFWMQNRRYLRLKNIQIAYNLPDSLLQKTFMATAKIYINGQNLWTLTPLKDFDPERDALQNHATATLPQSKIITMGVNLTF